MRKWPEILFAASAVALFLATPASAGNYNFDVKPGSTTKLFPLGQFENDTCMPIKPPKYELAQPKSGTFKVARAPVYLIKGICKGRSYQGLWLVYTPNRGFRGTDKGAIRIERMTHVDQVAPSMYRYTVNINVK